MVFIPHDRYCARVTASVPKFVRCIRCRAEWAYVLTRSGVGVMETVWGFGAQSAKLIAKGRARQALNNLLSNDCDVIPCPDCGALQPEMRAKHRAAMFMRLLKWTAGVLLLIAFAYPAIRKSISSHHAAWLTMWVTLGIAWALAAVWVFTHDVNANAA